LGEPKREKLARGDGAGFGAGFGAGVGAGAPPPKPNRESVDLGEDDERCSLVRVIVDPDLAD